MRSSVTVWIMSQLQSFDGADVLMRYCGTVQSAEYLQDRSRVSALITSESCMIQESRGLSARTFLSTSAKQLQAKLKASQDQTVQYHKSFWKTVMVEQCGDSARPAAKATLDRGTGC